MAELVSLPASENGKRVMVRGTIHDADGVSADFVDRNADVTTYLDIETMDSRLRDHVYANCAGIVVAASCTFVIEGEVVHHPASDGSEAYNELYGAKWVKPLRGT